MKTAYSLFAIVLSALLFPAALDSQEHSSFSREDSVWENPETDWMSEGRIGAFMHFLPDKDNFGKVEKQFDVEGLAEQLRQAGVSWFIFTLGQNSGYYNAPNPVYSRIAGTREGEKCSQRDLPMEIAEALEKRGIRLMLYLPCQTPDRDLEAVKTFGFPEAPADNNRHFTKKGAKNWAKVIRYWSKHYGTHVSGWWFDGGYSSCGFNPKIAELYSRAAKSGNSRSIVTFNPGISLKRASSAEDYTAGEIREPLKVSVTGRWIDGSQAHILTFLGGDWGKRDLRYSDKAWTDWLKSVTSRGGAVTFDVGPDYGTENGHAGLLDEEQVSQLRRIADGTRQRQP